MLIIDYAQNIALPHVAKTPSQWYFMPLVAVNVFRIYSASDEHQDNYTYTEGKGANEVMSMLAQFLDSSGSPTTRTLSGLR